MCVCVAQDRSAEKFSAPLARETQASGAQSRFANMVLELESAQKEGALRWRTRQCCWEDRFDEEDEDDDSGLGSFLVDDDEEGEEEEFEGGTTNEHYSDSFDS